MARTYLVFGDIEGKLDVLRVECARCQRKGRYRVRRLIEKIRALRQYDEMEGAALRAFALLVGHRPHSSSANRFTARASRFLLLIQSGERPDLYRESFRLETMPSRRSIQA
jgi:hypothetical protein